MNIKPLVGFILATPSCAWAQVWDCRTSVDSDVVVTATVDPNGNTGAVSLVGAREYYADFQVRGLARRWRFGIVEDYELSIQPSGAGTYSVRRNGNDWIRQDAFVCEERAVRQAREQAAAKLAVELLGNNTGRQPLP